jgi:hypothetical protein
MSMGNYWQAAGPMGPTNDEETDSRRPVRRYTNPSAGVGYFNQVPGQTAAAEPVQPAITAWTGTSPYVQRIYSTYGVRPVAGGGAIANLTPQESAEMSDYALYMARMEPLIAQAQADISGVYGAAAGQARQQAGLFGRAGERGAAATSGAYGAAANEAARLGQAGGTMVSGLSGPAQSFQTQYGSLPTMGRISEQGMNLATRSGVLDLNEYARQAAKSGDAAAQDFARQWDSLSAESKLILNSRVREQQAGRVDTARQAVVAQEAIERETRQQGAVSLYNGLFSEDKNTRKAAENTFRSYGFDTKSLKSDTRAAQRAALQIMASIPPEELLFYNTGG